jgi:hypothetical protein
MRAFLQYIFSGRRGYLALRIYVFAASVALFLMIFFYMRGVAIRLETEDDVLSSSIAKLSAMATFAAEEDERIRQLFREIFEEATERVEFPIVITDRRGVPIAWKGVVVDGRPVSPDSVTHEMYTNADPDNPPEGPLGQVMSVIEELDKKREPIPMRSTATGGRILGAVHYGESRLLSQLRLAPIVGTAAIAILVTLGFLGFRSIKLAEQRSIWVGMARETAHQLGTPISSLMGWVELMKEESTLDGKLVSVIDEIEKDVDRLRRIASRFSHIGSTPKMGPIDVAVVARETVEYMRTRAPRLGREVTLNENYDRTPMVEANRELLAWVMENLLKNALDAVENTKEPVIEVSTEYRKADAVVLISVKDNGSGIDPAKRQSIFAPGYSTKSKGWGLGLPLAKRIVEEFHKGKLYLAEGDPGVGSRFVVCLPAA